MAQNLSQEFSSVFTRDYAGKSPSVNTIFKNEKRGDLRQLIVTPSMNVNQIRGMKLKESPLGVYGIPFIFLVETIEQTSIL